MKLTQKQINQMRATIPHLDYRDLFVFKDALALGEAMLIAEYFDCFAAFNAAAERHFGLKARCIGCDLILEGGIMGFLLAGSPTHARLDWSLAHGVAHCSNCDWPYRIYHYDVGPIQSLSLALPYHPDGISVEAK